MKTTTFIGLVILLALRPAFAADSSQDIVTPELQVQALEAKASTGNEKAQMKLARMYLHGKDVEQHVGKAIGWYKLAAEQDMAFAQHTLARLYLDGDLVQQDIKLALAWLERAAALGFVQAQLDLSQLFESAQYMPPDYVNAYLWLNIAASLSDINIQARQEQLEAKMSFFELAQAKFLYRMCVMNDYQEC